MAREVKVDGFVRVASWAARAWRGRSWLEGPRPLAKSGTRAPRSRLLQPFGGNGQIAGMETSTHLTRLIRAAQDGDRDAADLAYDAVYSELRGLAHVIRRGSAQSALQTTALVHEAWMKLAVSPPGEVASRSHFKRIAGRAMRQVLVEEARARTALKRGGADAPITYQDALGVSDEGQIQPEQLIALDQAMRSLSKADPRAVSVVECRFFGGMDVKETAEALGISPATVKRDWRMARAWLAQALTT